MNRYTVSIPAKSTDTAVSITDSLGTSVAIPFHDFAGGRVHIESGGSLTSLTFYDCPYEGGTFNPSYDDTATTPVALTLTGLATGRSYPLPAKLFGAGWLKMVGNNTGTVRLILKS
jgi:hypothetical protein